MTPTIDQLPPPIYRAPIVCTRRGYATGPRVRRCAATCERCEEWAAQSFEARTAWLARCCAAEFVEACREGGAPDEDVAIDLDGMRATHEWYVRHGQRFGFEAFGAAVRAELA